MKTRSSSIFGCIIQQKDEEGEEGTGEREEEGGTGEREGEEGTGERRGRGRRVQASAMHRPKYSNTHIAIDMTKARHTSSPHTRMFEKDHHQPKTLTEHDVGVASSNNNNIVHN